MTARVYQAEAPAERPCPVCGQPGTRRFLSIEAVPVFCNVLHESREKACAAARADIHLAVCSGCAHVFNDAFEPELMAYSPRYENSLHHSGVFNEYADGLARQLVEAHALRGKRVVEIGCGQGDFLSQLCRAGGNRGIGFDPSYAGGALPPGVDRIERTYFSADALEERFDAIVCRQVLEHIDEPAAFVASLRRAIGERDCHVFFEVPNGLWCFGGGGAWDVIYEHCGYFTPMSLRRVFEAHGFEVLGVEPAFNGQFLSLNARTGGTRRDSDATPVDDVVNGVVAAASELVRTIEDWQARIDQMRTAGQKAAIWGAGSKGVTFLNVLSTEDVVDAAVDVNPKKQSMFVPGSGHRVIAPEQLRETGVDAVVVMNANYLEEISDMLAALGLGARVIDVGRSEQFIEAAR